MKNYIQTTEVFQRLQTYNLMALYKYAYYYYYYYIPRFVQCQFSVLPHHFGRTPDGHLRRLCEMSYLFKRLSVIVQRINSVLIHESFVSELHID